MAEEIAEGGRRDDAVEAAGIALAPFDGPEVDATIERALRIDPNNARLWNRLAAIRLEQGQPRQAEQLALKSNALSRGDTRLQARNWRLVARARWSMNDSTGARSAENKARELD